MGMYTQLVLGVELKSDTPETVIDILEYMIGHKPENQGIILPDHEFFQCNRWDFVLRCDSYYFDWTTRMNLDRDDLYPEYPKYCLTGCSNLKNYDDEIAKFLLWLAPYIDTNGFLGLTRYEDTDTPTLIYKWENDVIQFFLPEGAPNE